MFGKRDVAATVAVKSLEEARSFYQDTLGLEPVGEPEMETQTFKAGQSRVMLYESEYAGTNEATSLTWPLGDDFDGAVDTLRQKGVTFERYDMPDMTEADGVYSDNDMKVAWFKDPDGNIINIGNSPA